MIPRRAFSTGIMAISLAIVPALARAEEPIRIGITISQTGPAASLGIPQRNSVALLPNEIAGHKVDWIVLDDGSDSTKAVANTRKLIDEEKVDAVIGSSITPASLAMIPVVAEKQVPMISLAASAKIVDPSNPDTKWVFKVPQNDSLMADAIADWMAKKGVKTVGFIGFNDAYGDSWLTEATRALEAKGIRLVDVERYSRTDTSVIGQTLKLLAAKPDAVLIAGSGTPAALPRKDAEGARLHRPDLPDARRRQCRFPAGGRQGRGGHDPAGRPGAGRRPASRKQSHPQGRPRLRPRVRG